MIPTVQSTQLASTRDARTRVLKAIRVHTTLNVAFPSIAHCVTVHQAGAVILKLCATNVRNDNFDLTEICT